VYPKAGPGKNSYALIEEYTKISDRVRKKVLIQPGILFERV